MKIRENVYNIYWYFAAERQNIFFRKLSGGTSPYTSDPILQKYKFCNTYRASDRVSQFLIKDVIYAFEGDAESVVLRIILFRLFNNYKTWRLLEDRLGEQVSIKSFSIDGYATLLDAIKKDNKVLYGNAFILSAAKSFGYNQKHRNHLALIEDICFRYPHKLTKIILSKTLKELYQNLLELPLIGKFMAYQVATDLNYSEVFDFDENDFTMAGPGAVRGIAKCFVDIGKQNTSYVIHWMVDHQQEEFAKRGIQFRSLGGRLLHAIDCQGLFCETDKYCRMRFPDLKSNRKRIKTLYAPTDERIHFFYPPKWKLDFSSIYNNVTA